MRTIRYVPSLRCVSIRRNCIIYLHSSLVEGVSLVVEVSRLRKFLSQLLQLLENTLDETCNSLRTWNRLTTLRRNHQCLEQVDVPFLRRILSVSCYYTIAYWRQVSRNKIKLQLPYCTIRKSAHLAIYNIPATAYVRRWRSNTHTCDFSRNLNHTYYIYIYVRTGIQNFRCSRPAGDRDLEGIPIPRDRLFTLSFQSGSNSDGAFTLTIYSDGTEACKSNHVHVITWLHNSYV